MFGSSSPLHQRSKAFLSVRTTNSQLVPSVLNPENLYGLGARTVEISDADYLLHKHYQSKFCDKYVTQTKNPVVTRTFTYEDMLQEQKLKEIEAKKAMQS